MGMLLVHKPIKTTIRMYCPNLETELTPVSYFYKIIFSVLWYPLLISFMQKYSNLYYS